MNTKTIQTVLLSLCVAGVVFNGCEPRTHFAGNGKYGQIYMPQAVDLPDEHSLIMSDSVQTIIYGVDYGGPNYPNSDIQVHFSVNSALVDSFNTANGTNYKMMPAAGYKLSQKTAVIPAGNVKTKPLKLKIKTIGILQTHTNYLLPISLDTNDGIKINKDLQTTYFLINAHFILFDRSDWKVIDVDSHQENPNLPGKNTIDGNPNTFWHTMYSPQKPPLPHHIIIDMDTTHNVHGFKIAGRKGPVFLQRGNPVDIVIKVSSDKTNWGSGEAFTLPFNQTLSPPVTKVYFTKPTEGRYFKIVVKSTYLNVQFTHIAEIYAF